MSSSLRRLGAFSRVCPACAERSSDRGVCIDCVRETTASTGLWRTTLISSLHAPLGSVRVHHFGSYERPGGGRSRIADLLTTFKYRGDRRAGRALARIVATPPLALHERFDAVVPIPLTPKKLRSRGFNQAAWLARPLARALGLPLRAEFLHREFDNDAPQAGRNARDRRAGRPNPFTTLGIRLDGARLLLIDDVCTSGTTLARASRALTCAGALRVDAAVLLIARVVRARETV